ncbi:MAG: methylmalonyl-CoA mutase family protein [Gammaproteobacteria bacterium]
MATPAEAIETRTDAAGDRPLRFVTAASLFDGHDAAINIVRRVLQAHGAEVIHLGHNRSVAEIVTAALQEDADGIAVSSYQGGHMEYFKYMVDMLAESGAGHIRIVVGGGGTIVRDEIAELEAYGVEKVYSPDDGMRLGLDGMIADVFARIRAHRRTEAALPEAPTTDDAAVGEMLTRLEEGPPESEALAAFLKRIRRERRKVPVIGLTGTGGAGKSSLADELLIRFRRSWPDLKIAVVAVDPTRWRTGGALLGDRIRMNALAAGSIYMRSLATRRRHLATSAMLGETIDALKWAGFGLILLETAGIGQSDTEAAELVDYSLYVMTGEYGGPIQLEKIGMLDAADMIALNKFEKRGGEDALRDVKKQWRRNHTAFELPEDKVPVYPATASRFNDPGVNKLFRALIVGMREKLGLDPAFWAEPDFEDAPALRTAALIAPARERYLSEISANGRGAAREARQRSDAASQAQSYYEALTALIDPGLPAPFEAYFAAAVAGGGDDARSELRRQYNAALAKVGEEALALLREWPQRAAAAAADTYSYRVRGREITGSNYVESLSHLKIPKLAVPEFRDWGELLHFLLTENLPGAYPYTGGVYPYRRTAEDPTRMFAGEGDPERTNRRFHYLAKGQPATRLSTAFDSATLYGEDPDERPDIYGRIGNSGVSIATVDDMKKLYSGLDLNAPTTSVSMTINGPAPIILAMFMNAAVDQRVERHLKETGRWEETTRKIGKLRGDSAPGYRRELPDGHDGGGLGLLGVSSDQVVDAETYTRLREETLGSVRGTVQADILKEDQAQNTCIFSTGFAMRMMGDVQEYFIAHNVRNFYSVSVSGYHIAEAGANPVSQLAFTLANGFTIVEYYLARGMKIDDFAPNLSFFFSNGMDPEYAVIGRVARRIWGRAMRDLYRASPRSQMLKYHIQTSGRSLHAQEIQFNDIRTTLQALYALYDSCNSLHTNAYDEAITTPTEESVRRAVAIQMIINQELGLNKNENPLQGAFIVERLTAIVEEAVYQEFDRLSDRGGVLGAMETMYQRGKIQEESLYYERLKHSGELPIVGVNTFQGQALETPKEVALIRSTEHEKRGQIEALRAFQARHREAAEPALARLDLAARAGENLFAGLMEAVKVCSLGQISHALYRVGGRYRRNM